MPRSVFHISHVSLRSESPVSAWKAGVPGRAASSASEYSATGKRIEICRAMSASGMQGRGRGREREREGRTLMCQLEARAPLMARA